MNWLVPIVTGAAFLKPSPNPIPHGRLIPAPLQFKDPHQPNLDDPRGLPPQLSNKTYRGKIELKKPAILNEERKPYGTQFVNDLAALVPFTDQTMRIRLMQQQYRMTDQYKPFNNIKPDFRPYKVLMRYDGSFLSDHGRAAPSTAIPVRFDSNKGPTISRIRRPSTR